MKKFFTNLGYIIFFIFIWTLIIEFGACCIAGILLCLLGKGYENILILIFSFLITILLYKTFSKIKKTHKKNSKTNIKEHLKKNKKVNVLNIVFKKQTSNYATDKSNINKILNKQHQNITNYTELTEFYKEQSEQLYNIHLSNINNFSTKPHKIDNSPLTSVEKSFLKYINGLTVKKPYIAGYWTYEYNIDYNNTINKFIDNGYLKIRNHKEISKMTIPQLKSLLQKANIATKSNLRKADLIKLVNDNLSEDKINELLIGQEQYFHLTEKGKEITKDLMPSITKDLEFEDKCIEYIIQGNIEEAYSFICTFEINKNIPRGIGIDWQTELKRGLNPSKLQSYKNYMNNSLSSRLPNELVQYEDKLKACIIFAEMLGHNLYDIKPLFTRIIKADYEQNIIYKFISCSISGINPIDKNAFLSDYYQVLATLDSTTCPVCGNMDLKIFNSSEYEKGITAPPFHERLPLYYCSIF